MAPSAITEDYYMILEVEQTAAHQLIVSSYRRLALKLHPDRNAKNDTTEAFQTLARAYETLKDKSKRREYDLIYPSITTRRRSSPQNTQTPGPPPASASTPKSGTLSEAVQIAAIQKLKQERSVRWRSKKIAFDSLIFELQRGIRRLEQEIKNLDRIAAAEAAAEAQKNSWATWLLSPIYKKAEDSEEEKARKDRGRQERRIEKDMKERRLELNKENLKTQEHLLEKAREEVDDADLGDDMKIRVIQARIWARGNQERQERERREKAERERREKAERERMAKIRKQQQEEWEKRKREAAEALRKQQAENQAAEQKRHEEAARNWQKIMDEARKSREQYTNFGFAEGSTRQASTSTCVHGGWWGKVQGRTACPQCYDTWNYMLECPGCMIKACPKCQAAIRPRLPRNAGRTNRRVPPRVGTPSSDFGYDHW